MLPERRLHGVRQGDDGRRQGQDGGSRLSEHQTTTGLAEQLGSETGLERVQLPAQAR